ncbi:Uncharacterized protein GBIM_15886 [Gryllus bimaculatus]|nr:Uncharacterized protein GBIM_15886 [Gryllus bimaculatus]
MLFITVTRVMNGPDSGATYHALVLVPTAQILGGPDLHVDRGSTINLTCIIKYSPEPPAYIFWYHHDEEQPPSRLRLMALVELRITFNVFSQVPLRLPAPPPSRPHSALVCLAGTKPHFGGSILERPSRKKK